MRIKRKKKSFIRNVYSVPKVCQFCYDKIYEIDYKDIKRIRALTTEKGKIIPRRMSGVCAKHQRQLTTAISRARNIALLTFAA